MQRQITTGTTDVSVTVRIVDSSDGTPEEGVTSATGGLNLWYRREGAAVVNLTESDLSALTDAHSDGGMLHIDDGYYRIDVPDAAFASGSTGVLIGGSATGMIVIGAYIQLVAINLNDGVRAGLTALPNAAADAAGGLPISDAGGLDLDAQIGTDIDAILVDTNALNDTKIPDTISLAAINAEADTALTDYDPPTRAELTTDTNSILAKLLAYVQLLLRSDAAIATDNATELTAINADGGSGAGDYDNTTDSTEAIADAGGGGLTQQQVRDAMKLAPTGGAPAAGSVDEHLDDILTDTGAIETDTQDIQSRLPAALVSGRMDSNMQAAANGVITAAVIATDAFDADAIAADAVTEIQSGLATSAALATVDSNVDSILTDTNELQGDWTDGGRLDLIIDAILADTNELQSDDIPTLIAALPDAAAINAEVVDALSTDTYGEPGSVPAATATLAAKIGWLAALARNKVTQTSTTQTLRNDADSADVATAAVSDDGTTATRGEWT